jgi:hypothetical protein
LAFILSENTFAVKGLSLGFPAQPYGVLPRTLAIVLVVDELLNLAKQRRPLFCKLPFTLCTRDDALAAAEHEHDEIARGVTQNGAWKLAVLPTALVRVLFHELVQQERASQIHGAHDVLDVKAYEAQALA